MQRAVGLAAPARRAHVIVDEGVGHGSLLPGPQQRTCLARITRRTHELRADSRHSADIGQLPYQLAMPSERTIDIGSSVRSHIRAAEGGALPGWNSCNPGRTSSGRTISAGCSIIGLRSADTDHCRSGVAWTPASFAVPLDNLAWTEVVGADGDARFRIAFHGSQLAEAFGTDRLRRQVPRRLPAAALSAAPRSRPTGRSEQQGAGLHRLRHARPGGPDRPSRAPAAAVQPSAAPQTERILASIEAVSPEGPFELRDLMKSPIRPPVIALCTTIQY